MTSIAKQQVCKHIPAATEIDSTAEEWLENKHAAIE
jgi:hypothetical protein